MNQTGDIGAIGKNSFGILAQSVGSTNGNINITVNSGFIEGGSTGFAGVSFIGGGAATIGQGLEGGAGVGFLDGATNLLTNAGAITSVGRIDGFAITGTTGDENVVNNGLVIGSVDLAGGVNNFDNKPGAIFNAGTTVYLGPAGFLTNEELISPGNYGRVLTTDVTGNFIQTPTGIYGLDLNLDPTADRINVTGTAQVSGTVNINIMNPGLATPGSNVITILSAAGGETHPGLTLTYIPSAVTNFSLSYTPTDINLNYSINFAPGGLTINQTAVGQAVNIIQFARISPAFVPIATALFFQPNIAALGAVYNSISGEGVSGFEQSSFDANDLFLTSVSLQTNSWVSGRADPNDLTICDASILPGLGLPASAVDPNFGEKRPTPHACQRSWRAWFAGYGGSSNVSGEYPLGSADLHTNGSGVSAGLDYQLAPDVLLGVAGGAGSSGFGVGNRATSGSLHTGHVALYGAGRDGAFYASGILAYDFSTVNESRFAMIPGTNATLVPVPDLAANLNGNFGADLLSGRFETGWRTSFSPVNITPFAAFEFSTLNMHGFSETGDFLPGTLGLSFASKSIASLPSFLGAKFDTDFALPNDMLLTASLRVSWMHEFEVWRPVTASFQAAPGFDYTVYGALAPRNSARINAGLKLDFTKNVALFGNFLGDFSGKGEAIGGLGGVKLSW